jgi:hypothetical protein
MTATPIARPNTPRRVVLSSNAKHALTGAKMAVDGIYYLDAFAWDNAAISALCTLGLARGTSTGTYLTDAGERMRTYLEHQSRLRQLAKQVRAEGITGEDLADLTADMDQGIPTGDITGTTVDFQLAFALVASLSGQSAEDLRAELETHLGWTD